MSDFDDMDFGVHRPMTDPTTSDADTDKYDRLWRLVVGHAYPTDRLTRKTRNLLADLLADLDAANARADEAEAMCEWLDEELTEAYRDHQRAEALALCAVHNPEEGR